MIASLMIYSLAISTLISLGAVSIEWALAARAWPRRGVWLAAMLTSIGLPMLMTISGFASDSPVTDTLRADPSAPSIAAKPPSAAAAPATFPALEALRSAADLHWPSFPELDVALTVLWIAMSVGLLIFYVTGWLRLQRSMREWPVEIVEDEPIRVSDHSGPAVLGFVNPQVVIPRWLLSEPRPTRDLVIAHEREHIAARDPLCLLIGLVLVAAAPWNPLLWWQFRRLRFAIEVDCDARVLRRDVDLSAYGETLLSIGQHNSRALVGAMALTETASQLERRILIMTTRASPYRKSLMFAAVVMSISCMVVAAELGAPKQAVPETSSSAYTGDRVTLRLKDADVRDLVALLSHDSGRDVYISSKVGGKITIEFQDTRSDEALDIVLRRQRLVKRQDGNTIFIDTAPASTDSTMQPTYKGQRVNLRFQDIDIRTVVRVLADAAGQNIVVSENVRGTVTISLQNTPWDEALDTILRNHGLVRQQLGNIILIDVAPPAARGDAI